MGRRLTDADLAGILTKQGFEVDFKFRKNSVKSAGPSESQLQQAVIQWWHHACGAYAIPERLLMAFPLQAARTPRNGARMKAEGCRAGTLDLMLAVGRGPFHGLWIEMKTPRGVVSDEQSEMVHALLEQSFVVRICRSPEIAVQEIQDYLALGGGCDG
jgi:hypothetical protein